MISCQALKALLPKILLVNKILIINHLLINENPVRICGADNLFEACRAGHSVRVYALQPPFENGGYCSQAYAICPAPALTSEANGNPKGFNIYRKQSAAAARPQGGHTPHPTPPRHRLLWLTIEHEIILTEI